jgi:hypothetical protein
MPTAREQTLPLRHAQRRAGINTNARPGTFVRPLGPFARIQAQSCALEFIAAYDETFAPGARVTTLQAFGVETRSVTGRPPPGFSGSSSFALAEELFVSEEPSVLTQIPFAVEAGSTTEIFLTGYNFRGSPLDEFTVILDDATETEPASPNPKASFGSVSFVLDPESEGLIGLPAGITVVKGDLTTDPDHPASNDQVSPLEAVLHWRVERA